MPKTSEYKHEPKQSIDGLASFALKTPESEESTTTSLVDVDKIPEPIVERIDSDEEIETKIRQQFESKSIAELEVIDHDWENYLVMYDAMIDVYGAYVSSYEKYLREFLTRINVLKKDPSQPRISKETAEANAVKLKLAVQNDEKDTLNLLSEMKDSANDIGLADIIKGGNLIHLYSIESVNDFIDFEIVDIIIKAMHQNANDFIKPFKITNFIDNKSFSVDDLKAKYENEKRYYHEFKDFKAEQEQEAKIEGLSSDSESTKEPSLEKKLNRVREEVKKISFIYQVDPDWSVTKMTKYTQFVSTLENMTLQELNELEKKFSDAAILAFLVNDKNDAYQKLYTTYWNKIMKEAKLLFNKSISLPRLVFDMVDPPYRKSKEVLDMESQLETMHLEVDEAAKIFIQSLEGTHNLINITCTTEPEEDWRTAHYNSGERERYREEHHMFLKSTPIETNYVLKVENSQAKSVRSPDQFLNDFEQGANDLYWAINDYRGIILDAQQKGHVVQTVGDVRMIGVDRAEAAG